MSELSSETNPQILLNGEQRECQQDDAVTAEEQIPPVAKCLDAECSENSAAEKEAQAKMQSLFQQVRNQVRSQVGKKAPKRSIMELVQIVREMEIVQVNNDPDGKDVNSAEKDEAELFTDEDEDGVDLKEDDLCAVFEEKLEVSKKALRAEFEEHISQVRKEMQAYTDHALKDLECKMQSWKCNSLQHTHPKEQPKPSAAPSLAARRGRVLTRTMTTIVPKTCAPVIIGPRAKSETLTSPKADSSRLLPREPAFYLPGNKPYQSRKPLPPACPPLHQRKKSVQAKVKTGN